MKTLLKSAAMIGGLLLTGSLFAQSSTTKAASKPMTPIATKAATPAAPAAATTKATAWMPLNVTQMKTDLGLKPEQVTKITDVNTRFEKEHQELQQAEGKTSADQMNARLAGLEQRRTKEVRSILDAEQAKKWEGTQTTMAPKPTSPKPAGAPAPTQPAKKEAK